MGPLSSPDGAVLEIIGNRKELKHSIGGELHGASIKQICACCLSRTLTRLCHLRPLALHLLVTVLEVQEDLHLHVEVLLLAVTVHLTSVVHSSLRMKGQFPLQLGRARGPRSPPQRPVPAGTGRWGICVGVPLPLSGVYPNMNVVVKGVTPPTIPNTFYMVASLTSS